MSWFNIFLHPKKYAREIKEIHELLTQHVQYSDQVEKENNNLKEEIILRDNNITELQNYINELQNNIATLNQTIDLLSSQLSDNSKELSSTRDQLNQDNKDLELVSEIGNLFEKVKQRHENYEKRIKELTDSLNQAHKQLDALSTYDRSDEITTINMAIINDTIPNTQTQKSNSIPPLQPKTPSLFEKEETTTTNLNNYDDNTSDDWLLPLPEDL